PASANPANATTASVTSTLMARSSSWTASVSDSRSRLTLGEASPMSPRLAVLELVKAPDPRLKLVSEPVAEVDKALRRFLDDMVETMYAANGIGLAAIQIGVPKRIAVIDLDPGGPNSKVLYIVNPRIVDASGELSTYHEGCLSVPEVWDDVKRPARLTVEYSDENNQVQTVDA